MSDRTREVLKLDAVTYVHTLAIECIHSKDVPIYSTILSRGREAGSPLNRTPTRHTLGPLNRRTNKLLHGT